MEIEKLNYEQAKEAFKKSSIAIKDDYSISAIVGDKLLKIILSTERYTLTPLDHWNKEMIFDPNSPIYLSTNAFLVTTKNLDEIVKNMRSLDYD